MEQKELETVRKAFYSLNSLTIRCLKAPSKGTALLEALSIKSFLSLVG